MNSPRFTVLAVVLLHTLLVNAQVRQRVTGPVGNSNQPSSQGKSTVRGRVVYNDGQPLKGVRVRVFTTQEDPSTPRLVALANDQGEFQLTGLTAGKYYVSVEGAGAPSPSGMGMRIPLPISAIPGPQDYPEIIPKHDAEFTVDGGNTVEVEVKIIRGGAMTGKVLKPNGAPVPDAAVNVLTRDGGGPYMGRFSTRTDKNGAFRIENLPPADYIISAAIEKQGNFDALARVRGDGQIVTYHPAALGLADALPVRVDSGRESGGVNITLVARKSFRVSGSVVHGRDGSPLAGATVVLRNKETDITGPLVPGMMQRTTETGPDGRWSFPNVEEGQYDIVALNELGGQTRGAVIASPRIGGPPQLGRMGPGPRPRFLMAQKEVNLIGTNIEGLILTISGPGSIRGVVETAAGQPAPAGLVLFFEFSNEGLRPGRPMPVRVNADGSFLLTDVQGGETYVNAALQSGSRHFIESAEINGLQLTSAPLTVVEGGDIGPITIKLSDQFAVLSGNLVSQNTSRDLLVLLIPADANRQRFRTAYTAAQAAADGSFSVSLAPGEYLILAKSRQEMPVVVTPEYVRTVSSSLPRVNLQPAERKKMDIEVR